MRLLMILLILLSPLTLASPPEAGPCKLVASTKKYTLYRCGDKLITVKREKVKNVQR